MELDLETLEAVVAKFRADYPMAGWRCAAHFSPYMKDTDEPYEFLWPERKERVWVIPEGCKPDLVPYLANGTLTELDRHAFLDWFTAWTREVATITPSDTVH
jgi:hypothetical protein